MTHFLFTLATWRLSHLLSQERGPYDLLGKLRDWAGVYYDEQSACQGKTELASALCCIWCTSFWVGLLLARGNPVKALAYSAGAILLDKAVGV